MEIISNYPGGNIRFLGMCKKDNLTEVYLEQDLTGCSRWWFYWNFKVVNPPKSPVMFCFLNNEVVSPKGCAVSLDGTNWEYCEKAYIDGTHFVFDFSADSSDRYFAFSLPYQLKNFELFYDCIKANVSRNVLTRSENGAEIPILTYGEGKNDIVITARHHCCESTASYALEGLVSETLDDAELLRNYHFHIIPFIDIDGVENGDQGKDRIPHDHNRDYSENPIYNSTKAIYKYCEKLNIIVFLDFYSPWKWGGADDIPHLHLSEIKSNDLQKAFVRNLIEQSSSQPDDAIKFYGRISEYGSDFNKFGTKSAKNYFLEKYSSRLSLTIETPYSGNLSKPYSVNLLREWGKVAARALSLTLGN